jgi:tRNA A37 threonylcarbamoyladenosine dehydratase
MGAAARLDPTRVRVDDLARTHHDPFAHHFREILRKKHGWRFGTRPTGVACVFSDERPIAPTELAYDSPEGFQCVCPQSSDNGAAHLRRSARASTAARRG